MAGYLSLSSSKPFESVGGIHNFLWLFHQNYLLSHLAKALCGDHPPIHSAGLFVQGDRHGPHFGTIFPFFRIQACHSGFYLHPSPYFEKIPAIHRINPIPNRIIHRPYQTMQWLITVILRGYQKIVFTSVLLWCIEPLLVRLRDTRHSVATHNA